MHGRILTVIAGVFVFVASAREYLVKWRDQAHGPSGLSKIEISDTENSQLEKYRSRNDVEYVVANAAIHAEIILPASSHEQLSLQPQWALSMVDATDAWKATTGSKNINVAIADTGVDSQHESLGPNLIPGWNFIDNNADTTDVVSFLNAGHGTHCAGVVGATGLINDGTSGLSPKISMMPLRVLDQTASGTVANAVDAIDYAIAHNVQIISASWSGTMTSDEAQPLGEAIQRADAAGILFVDSAGNGDDDGNAYLLDNQNIYPPKFNFDNMITVGASDGNDQMASFSNYSETFVHVLAPGVNILSTLPMNRYLELTGTSMAAPLVAGLATLLLSINPTLTPQQLKQMILASGSPVDAAVECHCRIDAAAAVKKVAGMSEKVLDAF